MSRLPTVVLFSLLLAGGLAPLGPGAAAQVRRCVGPDGGVIYTDRACAAFGASPRAQDEPQAGGRFHRPGCQRQLRGLILEMSHAIHGGDTNRLASVYHWRGLSHSGGYRILERLDAIAQRPLLDITPQRPAPRVPPPPVGQFSGWVNARDIPTAEPERPPSSLRVDQGGPGGTGRTQTVFSLHRYLGCWWVSL